MNDEFIIGMLSGTSRDGVDAVLVNFTRDTMAIMHAKCAPYPVAIKLTLDKLIATGRPPSANIASLLDENLGRFFARVAQDLVREAGMEMRDVRAIGSHGQTVWHDPDNNPPVSIQLGKPELIARGTGTTVVGDFRRADLEAGGQGAPLAPLLHQRLFYSENEDRAILNIGGIANLTMLPVQGGISGFDCGPGNCLMDIWTRHHLHKDYDNNGNWASRGSVNIKLLEHMLEDPYFSLEPPKSTGLEYFNMHWLDNNLADSDLAPMDVQSTLAELTALSIGHCFPDTKPARLLVCGGGTHNAFLMRRIAAALPEVIVESTARHGADPDWVEGLLFAWLARERIHEKTVDTAPFTGATHPILSGRIAHPPQK